MNDFWGPFVILPIFVIVGGAWVLWTYHRYRQIKKAGGLPESAPKGAVLRVLEETTTFVPGVVGFEWGKRLVEKHPHWAPILPFVLAIVMFLGGLPLIAVGLVVIAVILFANPFLKSYIPTYKKESPLAQTIYIILIFVALALIVSQFVLAPEQ